MIASTELYKEMCFKNISFFFQLPFMFLFFCEFITATTRMTPDCFPSLRLCEKKVCEHWRRKLRKPTLWHERSTKTHISMRIRAGWYESSFSAYEVILHLLLSKMRTVKILMILHECTGWSESLLSPHVRRYAFLAYGSFDPHLDKMYLSNMRTTKAQGRLLINRYENKPIQI